MRKVGKYSKKSSLVTCCGTTTRVSMSEPAWSQLLISSSRNARELTRSIDAKAIAPECEDLAAGFLHHRLREVSSLTDMFHEFDSDPLYELKCRFPRFT